MSLNYVFYPRNIFITNLTVNKKSFLKNDTLPLKRKLIEKKNNSGMCC